MNSSRVEIGVEPVRHIRYRALVAWVLLKRDVYIYSESAEGRGAIRWRVMEAISCFLKRGKGYCESREKHLLGTNGHDSKC